MEMNAKVKRTYAPTKHSKFWFKRGALLALISFKYTEMK